MKTMNGHMSPDRNCAFQALAKRASLRRWNSSRADASALKARMTAWPEKDSSMWPLSAPS